MKKINFKKGIRLLHLWLGLGSGFIVFIVAVTGCLYAFQEEIQNITQEYRFVEKQKTSFLLPSQLLPIAQKELPNKVLHALKYNAPDQAVEAIFYHYEPTYHYVVYLNPYSGKVLKVANMEDGFFRFILDGHFYLWLPHEIGQVVVASATLTFLVLLVSGLILWFPKNKKAAKQRFWFRWKEGLKWKRKNYDLHNITGFYVSAIGLIFAITGLVWGFPWFAYGYYKIIGGEKSLLYEDPVSKEVALAKKIENPLDKVFLLMQEQYPKAAYIEVHPPENPKIAIATNANLQKGTYWKTDYRYFDQNTLEEKEVTHIYGKIAKADTSDRLLRMNYDIHTGAIMGLAGKVFAFLISLFIATLPITGCLIWYGRKKAK